MKKIKRITAFLLCFCMVWNLSVPQAFAASGLDTDINNEKQAAEKATDSNAGKEQGEDSRSEKDAATATSSNTPHKSETATAADAVKRYSGNVELVIVNNNNGEAIPITKGDSYQLDVEITPADEGIQPEFESNDTSVATVDENGLITALETGGTSVTASVKDSDGNFLDLASVRINVVEQETVTITLHGNGGLFQDGSSEKSLVAKIGTSLWVPSITYEGMSFTGWYSDVGCSQLVTDNSYINAQEDLELYAGWTESCTVTFDFGGYKDSNQKTEKTYEVGKGLRLTHVPSMPAEPSDKTNNKMFAGWKTPDGTILSASDIWNYKPSGNETIVAQWVDYYTITYDYGGIYYNGSDSSTEFVMPGEKVKRYPYLPDGPSQETNQKMFIGWKNSEGRVISRNDIWNYIPQRSENLTAQWSGYYEINFDYNGVEYNGATNYIRQIIAGDRVSAPYIPNDPSQTGGKAFIGWKIPSGEILTGYNVNRYCPAGNETIVAQWGEYYTVTFDYNGVTYNGNQKQTYQLAVGLPLENNYSYIPENPENTEGKMFTGWKNAEGTIISGNDIRDYIPAGDEVLTAQWTTDFYTVLMDYNGVTYSGQTQSNAYAMPGSTLKNYPYFPSDPSQTEGKSFLGWESEASGTFTPENNIYSYVPSGNETLTAKWAEATLEITFDYSGITYNGKTSTTVLTVPGTELGYKIPSFSQNPADTAGKLLKGWKADGKFYTEAEVREMVPAAAMTFLACWTEEYYKVTFDYNGIVYDQKRFEEKYALPGRSIGTTPGIPNEPYEAYNQVLLGWQTEGGELISNDEVSRYIPSGNETLTARWSKYVTVTYDANGGKANSKKEYVPLGEAVRRANNPTRTGYKFAGWFEKETGKRAENDVYLPTADVTLVAQWKEFYTLTYDANGGSYTYDSYKTAEVIKGEGTYLNGEYGYKKEGFTLEGWCEDPECEGPVLTGNYIPERDTVLYAKWTTYYTVTLDPGIGSVSSNTVIVKAGESIGYLNNPQSREAAFDGWYLDQEWTRRATKGYIPEADVTLYAKWSSNTYRVTFHAGGAWIYDNQSQEYAGEVTRQAEKNRPLAESSISTNRSGYECIWYLDQEYQTPFNWSSAVEADLDLYAAWRKTIKVYWDADGGRDTSGKTNGSFIVRQGEAYSLPKVERDGYGLAGWVTDDGTEVTGQTRFYENNSIKAVWTTGYRVSLDAAGGAFAKSDYYKPVFYVKPGEKCGYRPAPTREGCAFAGWFDENGRDIGMIYSYQPQKDTKLTAHWTEDYVTVRFHAGGGELYDDSKGTYVQMMEVRVPRNRSYYEVTGTVPSEQELDGMVSDGWALTEGGMESIDLVSYPFAADADLYPVWKECWYIGVELMGGFLNGNRDQHDRGYLVPRGADLASSQLTAKYLSKPGYIFGGWYASVDYSGQKYEIPFKPEGNMTLYAKWLEGDGSLFTVSFDAAGGREERARR